MPSELNIITGLIALAVVLALIIIGVPKLTRKVEVLEPEVLRAATMASYHAYQQAVIRLHLLAVQAQADADAAAAQLAALQKTLGVVIPTAANAPVKYSP